MQFAPDSKTLWDYKKGKIDEQQYTYEYTNSLNKIDVQSIINSDIKKAKFLGYQGIIYLCYEKKGDFCHRNILAEYCNKEYGLDIKEYKILRRPLICR